jgi:bifunctional ADP-heptose synthase (sugar kinase/adenylyltransferase)
MTNIIKSLDKLVKNFDRLKEFKIPDILVVAFEYEKDKFVYIDNTVTCKGCGDKLKFNLDTRTSNLITHLRDTNFVKHIA